MNKVSNWLRKHLTEILVFLLIIVIVLYIINFSEAISNKAVDIIVAISATFSTFFLFLAFRESKLSNELKINEPILNQIEKKTLEKESKATQPVFIEYNRELNNPLLPTSVALNQSTYSNFLRPLYQTLIDIQEDSGYMNLLKVVKTTNKPVVLSDRYTIDEASRYARAFRVLRLGIRALVYNYIEIYFIYDSINASSLPIQQKKYLYDRLDPISHDFFYFFKTKSIQESNDFELTSFLKEFIWFDINADNQIYKCSSSFDYLNAGFDYTSIIDKEKG
jgi:hypothetical protein